MSVRRLTPSDAIAYRALMLEAYGRHPESFTSDRAEREALALSWWETRLAANPEAGSVVLGGFVGGALVGAVGLRFESREKIRHKATLFGMYVVPGERGRGLGGELVVAVLETARTRPGVGVVQLTVSEGNDAALQLYRRAGFVAFGTEPLAVRVGMGFVAKVHLWRELG